MKDIASYIITEPTSALEVGRRVCALVREEPKRMRMGHFFCTNPIGYGYSNPPRCNTIGCIAGWTGFVSGDGEMAERAADLFFNPGTEGNRELKAGFFEGKHFILEDGSPEQAEEAALFLERIMAKYKDELSRRIIQPVRKGRQC